MEKLRLFLIYSSPGIVVLRIIISVLLAISISASYSNNLLPNVFIFALSVLMMFEVYVFFRKRGYKPEYEVLVNRTGDPRCSMSAKVISLSHKYKPGSYLISHLCSDKDTLYLLGKLEIDHDLLKKNIDLDEVFKKAFDLVLGLKGRYITTIDIFAGIVLILEDKEKILFKNKIKENEFLNLIRFYRVKYENREISRPKVFNFKGEGFADYLTTGWTPETANFTIDWTARSLSSKKYIIGREKEYEDFINALYKSEMNNVVLVGEPGVGKQSLITALIQDSFSGALSFNLNHKRVLELMVGNLIAGDMQNGMMEKRITEIIEEISHSGNVFLYIPELQNILGSSDFHLNLAGILMPHLKESRLPVIATMTPGNYKKYLQNNPLLDLFTVINLYEPQGESIVNMIIDRSEKIEHDYGCIIAYSALLSSIKLSKNYLPDSSLPGSAVKLLLSCAAEKNKKSKHNSVVTEKDIVDFVEQKVNASIGEPNNEEKNLLLHLEDKIHEKVINQEHAVKAIAEGIRRVREGFASRNKPISFLFLGPTGVGKTETAKALASIYFKGEDKMLRFDMSEYSDENGVRRLLGSLPGEGDEKGELTDKIHDNPYSLVLLDEFEKAHPHIHDLFLQVLDDGRLTDNRGKTAYFNNCVIIATSNAGSEVIREHVLSGKNVDSNFQAFLLNKLQVEHVFKPELLNRFDDLIVFAPLDEKHREDVVTLLLKDLEDLLLEQDISIEFSSEVIGKIALDGYDAQFGARPLKRYLQDNIEDVLAKMKLEDKLGRGDKVRLILENSKIKFEVLKNQ